jgi:hypothetical protein
VKKHLALLLVVSAMLAGCARVTVFGHTVHEGTEPAASRAAEPVAQQYRSVDVVFSPQARMTVAVDPLFNAELMQKTVEKELQSRNLVNATDAKVTDVVELRIDDLGIVRTSNVILFGKVTGAGTLTGLVRILDADGKESRSFKVVAEAQVGIPKEGDTSDALKPVYRRFAEMTSAGLGAR